MYDAYAMNHNHKKWGNIVHLHNTLDGLIHIKLENVLNLYTLRTVYI